MLSHAYKSNHKCMPTHNHWSELIIIWIYIIFRFSSLQPHVTNQPSFTSNKNIVSGTHNCWGNLQTTSYYLFSVTKSLHSIWLSCVKNIWKTYYTRLYNYVLLTYKWPISLFPGYHSVPFVLCLLPWVRTLQTLVLFPGTQI